MKKKILLGCFLMMFVSIVGFCQEKHKVDAKDVTIVKANDSVKGMEFVGEIDESLTKGPYAGIKKFEKDIAPKLKEKAAKMGANYVLIKDEKTTGSPVSKTIRFIATAYKGEPKKTDSN